MAVTSRVLFDARSPPRPLSALGPDTELVLSHATRVSAPHARSWRSQLRPGDTLTVLLEAQDLPQLRMAPWLAAFAPHRIDLQTPAWTPAAMRAVGWDAGFGVLVGALRALRPTGVAVRIVLHVSAATVADLTESALSRLAAMLGGAPTAFVLTPMPGEQAPDLGAFASATARLSRSTLPLVVSRLFPACAVAPTSDGKPSFASQRRSLGQEFREPCAACPLRTDGRCDGMSADFLVGERAAAWQGWETWSTQRNAVAPPDGSDDPPELTAMRLGLRKVWRSELPVHQADLLRANLPDGLHIVLGRRADFDPQGRIPSERETADWQIQYLAPNQEDALAALAAEAVLDQPEGPAIGAAHRELGALLGFPSCCVEEYVAATAEHLQSRWSGVAQNAHGVLRAARASAYLDRRLDGATSVGDAILLRHAPCRFDCQPSLALIQAIEASWARTMPGRLARRQCALPDAALLFADGAEIPLTGERDDQGRLWWPGAQGPWPQDGARARLTRTAWAQVQAQVTRCVALEPTHDLAGPGGVTLIGQDGRRADLSVATGHHEFPRLLVFAPLHFTLPAITSATRSAKPLKPPA